MPRYSRPAYTSIGYPPWPPGVKAIVIACAITFGLQIIAGSGFTELFGLRPSDVLSHGYVWQLVTYIFLHDTRNILHILFNMLGLWMFGSDLELLWGTRSFIKFFFICGVGAGVIYTLLSLAQGTGDILTIGASGAVYGVLLAYGVLFPDRIIYYVIFPIKARYFVMIMGGIALFSSVMARNSGTAHVAHLGGMACGYLYLKGRGIMRSRRGRGVRTLRGWYDEWKRNRMRRKFEVYYNERHKKDDDNKWGRWKN
jgi:membrane associated rhomboid family serine protease